MIHPYPFQNDMIAKTRQALRYVRRVLLQSATGSGKTVMAGQMISNATAKSHRVFFICHRKELLEQTALTFDKFGLDYGFIAAGMPVNYFKNVQICSIDTLKNRLDAVPEPDLCVWDEAHHLAAGGWSRVQDHYGSKFHIGLSATPQRLDGKGLDDKFDFLVPGPSVGWLINEGHLANYRLFSPGQLDEKSLHKSMGDFVKKESAAAMRKPSITGDIVAHWQASAADKLTIGFEVSIKNSELRAAEFMAAGITAVHLDGETPDKDRREMLRDFARGNINVIFNVGLFGEGFDAAANSGMDVTVGAVIDAAPTQSLSAWLQRCGRALRPQEMAVILDHANNVRHGLPCDERVWTLQGRDADARASAGADSVRQCPSCFLAHRPAPVCPHCKHVYEIQHREIEHREGELEEMDIEKARFQQRQDQWQASTEEELIALRKRSGYKKGWEVHLAAARAEKEALRTNLFNLTVGAKPLGLDFGLTMRDIRKLKPKQLKEKISEIEHAMKSSPQIQGRQHGQA